ncbi:MAG: hypothetical protein GY835_19945 [bacterium]|nr:hypothetical protein [bacterium]
MLSRGHRKWSLAILTEEGIDPGNLGLPAEVSDWDIISCRLDEVDPGKFRPAILLLAFHPSHEGLSLWLNRFRLLNNDTLILLAEGEEEVQWYRAAISLGVDQLLKLPLDEQGWLTFLGETAEMLSMDSEQNVFLGRLERSTESLEESRRGLAEMLIKSYENLGRMHGQLTSRLGQLSTLYQLGRDLSLESNWDGALDRFLKTCVETLDFEGVALMLWSFDSSRLAVRSRLSIADTTLNDCVERLLGLGAEKGSAAELIYLTEGGLQVGKHEEAMGIDWRLLALPLMHGGEAQGFLILGKTYATYSDFESDFHFLKTVQTILGEEIANAKAMHSLKKLEEFNRTILESIHAAVLTVDGYGKVSYRNPQAGVLFGSRLLPGTPFGFDHDFHLIDGDESGLGVSDWIQRECLFRRPDTNEEKRLLISTTSLPVRHKADIQYVMISEDLTEYKKLESELRRAERLSSLGSLSAGMAHEIRNPLAGIAMTAQVLRVKLREMPEATTFLDRIHEETLRLERIVRSLLDFSKPAPPRLAVLDLRELAERILLDLAPQAATAGVVLAGVDASDAVPVWADRDQIHQIVLNLVLNAIQACADGDCVNIRIVRAAAARGGEGRVRLCVADTGPGVPEELQSKLFDPFFTTKVEGTGLGLSVCQKIMEEHGSGMRYRATESGGAEFSFDLAPAAMKTKA